MELLIQIQVREMVFIGEVIILMIQKKNVIILNVLPLSKQPNRLKSIIAKLKSHTGKIDGDIALLSSDSILLTPSHVKIVKSKPKPSGTKIE